MLEFYVIMWFIEELLVCGLLVSDVYMFIGCLGRVCVFMGCLLLWSS